MYSGVQDFPPQFDQPVHPPRNRNLYSGVQDKKLPPLLNTPPKLNPKQFAQSQSKQFRPNALRQVIPKAIEEATGAMQRNRAFRHGGLGMALRYTIGAPPLSRGAAPIFQAEAWQHLSQPED